MRDRLIKLIKYCTSCEECRDEDLADHLLANGVIVPPCKLGDRMWAIRDYKGKKHPQEGIVSEMFFTQNMRLMIVVKNIARGEFGKIVFLTRKEAEKALKKRDNQNGE